MLALHIMSDGMADLNAQEEYSLDSTLYGAFKGRIPERLLKEKYIIIDQARMSKKENRKIVLAGFTAVGLAVDIYLIYKFAIGIVNFAKTAFSFGKGLYNAFRLARIGLTVKNIPALAKVAAKYTKTAFMNQKIVVKISKIGQNFKEITKNYRNSVRLNALRNAAQYTNSFHEFVASSLNTLRISESTNLTKGITKIVKGVKFDEELGIFVLNKSSQIPRQLLEVVNDIVGSATTNAKTKYRVARLFKKSANFKEMFLEEVKNLIAASPLRAEDQKFLVTFLIVQILALNSGKLNLISVQLFL